jgi:glutamate-1-semialdehyde 2,1-aminomutase
VANGFPLAWSAARPKYMDSIIDPDPARRPFVAGTYNGHPVAVAAAIETVRYLVANRHAIYPGWRRWARRWKRGSWAFSPAAHQGLRRPPRLGFLLLFHGKAAADLHDIIQNHDFAGTWPAPRPDPARGLFRAHRHKQCSLSAAHSDADVAFTLEQLESAVAATF